MLPTQCPICGPDSYVYKDKYVLQSHMYKKHPADETRNQCKICGPDSRVYASVDYLREHMRTKHEPKDKMVCPTCERSFETKRNLTRNLQRQVCSQPNSRYQRSLAVTITATGGAILQQPEGTPEDVAPDTSLDGCGQGEVGIGYSEKAHMSDEMYQTYIQPNTGPYNTGPGTTGIDETCQAEHPMMNFEEHQAQIHFYQQLDTDPVLLRQADPNVLNSSSNFAMGYDPLAQATSFPGAIDQGQIVTPDTASTNTSEIVWSSWHQSPFIKIGAGSTHDFGFECSHLDQSESSQTQLTQQSSMTNEEYQGYLCSIGLY